MADLQFEYYEGEASGLSQPQTTLVGRNGVEDIYDVLDFLRNALRAFGYDWVDRVGVATELGEQKWNKF